MENGRKMEHTSQNPRTQYYPNSKNKIPRSGQSQEQGYQSVPHWEKKFCTTICKIPWKKICETQKLTYLYPKIDKWDDSGAKEAFDKGKARYWAEINNLPCDIPWPSPDEYIDVIDHDAIVDPELIEDLYKVPETIDDERGGESNICWDSFQLALYTVPVTGWGDDEEKYNNQAMYSNAIDRHINIQPTGWGDDVINNNYNNEAVIQNQPTGWGYENKQAPELNKVNQFLEEQSNQWIERKNPSNKINSTDKYGGFQVNRDYNYSKKEFGSNSYKGRKKAFYAINPSVNWKAQRESSWQWHDEREGESNVCWDSFQLALDTGRGDDEEKYNNQAMYTNATDRYINIQPTGWGDDVIKSKYNNKVVIQNQPTGWGDENEQTPELNNVNQFREEQSNQWIERENLSNEINSTDKYGGFQVSRDYNYSKKELGSKRYKGRKKAFHAINPSVNWKAQRESSWQWQKIVS